jgi:predicted RNase H-like HicB family nuclease
MINRDYKERYEDLYEDLKSILKLYFEVKHDDGTLYPDDVAWEETLQSLEKDLLKEIKRK